MPRGAENSAPETGNQFRYGNNPQDSYSSNPFSKAIKDAERSLLIFNLDMVQNPCMSPSTMSSKVTVFLLNMKAEKEGKLQTVRHRLTWNLLTKCLARSSKLSFGKKTSPLLIPSKPKLNGK
jgi:hypothetical protein